VRVENVRVVRAFVFWRGGEQENFAQIAGRAIQAAVGRGSERGDLRRACLQQVGVLAVGTERENMSAVAGAGEELSIVESECVDDVVFAAPDAARLAVGRDQVDVGTARRSRAAETLNRNRRRG
jgi:hypothetical protein